MEHLEFRSFYVLSNKCKFITETGVLQKGTFSIPQKSEINTFCITPVVSSAMDIRLYHASKKLPTAKP